MKKLKFNKKYVIALFSTLLALTGGVFAGSKLFAEHQVDVKSTTEIVLDDYKIELAVEPVDTILTTEDGEIEVEQYPTVESIDGGNVTCENQEGECGLGSYVYAPTATYTEFKDYTLNKCWNLDSFAGSQCWDLGELF